jgi:sortase A
VAAVITAATFLLNALWIPAKAELAQHLLTRSWQQTLAGNPDAKPWPWADTRAIAELEVPRLAQTAIILQGSSGRNLAFGPTLINSTPIDETGDRILSAHRDTHFGFLKDLETGDLLRLTTANGVQEYRVSWSEVVNSQEQSLVIDNSQSRLTLLTCYPFDAVVAGGPLRWVVTAVAVTSG